MQKIKRRTGPKKMSGFVKACIITLLVLVLIALGYLGAYFLTSFL